MLRSPLPHALALLAIPLFFLAFACTKKASETPESEPASSARGQGSARGGGGGGQGGGGGGGQGGGGGGGQGVDGQGQGQGGLRKNRGQRCGVYVDGEPIALLSHAELPRGLEPVWVEQTRHLPFEPGEERKTVTEKARRYRLIDYLESMQIPVDEVTAVHIHHGRGMIAEVTGAGLREHPDEVMFRFGGDTQGKTIPVFRDNAPVNRRFDHMVALTIYVKKAPPKLNEDDKPTVNGELVEGIAYNEKPLRNGARVYVDDRLALVLNRQMLAANGEEPTLSRLLAARGTPLDKVVYGVLIANDGRSDLLAPRSLLSAPVSRNDEARGFALALDGKSSSFDAVALYTSKPK